MSNPALDSQIKIALRDDKTAEKFAEHIAELAAQIVNATFKFAQDVKSTYESVPKRRLGDKNFDEIDQARARPGRVQLLYACSRSVFYSYGYPDYERHGLRFHI